MSASDDVRVRHLHRNAQMSFVACHVWNLIDVRGKILLVFQYRSEQGCLLVFFFLELLVLCLSSRQGLPHFEQTLQK